MIRAILATLSAAILVYILYLTYIISYTGVNPFQ